MGNTTNTTGQITTFGVDANLAGLVDGTDKMHSGILKALFAASTGNYVYSLDSNGISQGSGSTYTRFTVDNDIVFYRNGERFVITGTNLFTDIDTAPHASYDRYDLLVIIANNTLDIRTGVAAAAPTVGVLTDGDVPMALIRVVAGTANQLATRPIQMYTAADSEKAISHTSSSGDGIIQNVTSDKDIIFKGNDGGSTITALTLDMSAAGAAAFNSTVTATGFTIGSAAITETELEILDGATLSTTELNILDGVTGVTAAELTYVGSVTSDIQTQLNAKQATITGSATTIDTESLTASRAVISNGSQKIAVSATTSTELGYVNGLTSAVQTQLNTKLQTGLHTIWVPATAMYATTTTGCSALTQVEQTALRPELKVLDFAADADDHAQFSIAMPKNWNEGVIQFQSFWTVTGTDTGLVAWGLTAQSVVNSGVTNTGFSALTTNTPLAHSGTSNDLMVSAASGNVTVLNAAADSVTYFMIARDYSAEAADRQTGVARLIGIKILYTIDGVNDAP